MIQQGSSTSLWKDLVHHSAKDCGVSEMVEAYVVFTLARYLRDGYLAKCIFALEWINIAENQATNQEAWQKLGDRCLIVCGLFPEWSRKGGVSPNYLESLGRSAYCQAVKCSKTSLTPVLIEVEPAFPAIRACLNDIRAGQ